MGKKKNVCPSMRLLSQFIRVTCTITTTSRIQLLVIVAAIKSICMLHWTTGWILLTCNVHVPRIIWFIYQLCKSNVGACMYCIMPYTTHLYSHLPQIHRPHGIMRDFFSDYAGFLGSLCRKYRKLCGELHNIMRDCAIFHKC